MSGSPPDGRETGERSKKQKRSIAQVSNSEQTGTGSSDRSSRTESSSAGEGELVSGSESDLPPRKRVSVQGPAHSQDAGLPVADKMMGGTKNAGTVAGALSSTNVQSLGSNNIPSLDFSSFGSVGLPLASSSLQGAAGSGLNMNMPLMANALTQQQTALAFNPLAGLMAPNGAYLPFVPPQMIAGSFANPLGSAVPQGGINTQLLVSYLLSGGSTSRLPPSLALMQSTPQARGLHVAEATPFLSGRGDLTNQQGVQGTAGGPHSQPGPQLPILFTRVDEEVLSEYQVMLRKQIEFFKSGPEDVETTTPGRHREIVLDQVGIRCRHCVHLPLHMRAKGSVYYPSMLKGLYQAAQNMSSSHLCKSCESIHPAIRAQLLAHNEGKSSSGYGGKQYWADTAKAQGIIETDTGLRYVPGN